MIRSDSSAWKSYTGVASKQNTDNTPAVCCCSPCGALLSNIFRVNIFRSPPETPLTVITSTMSLQEELVDVVSPWQVQDNRSTDNINKPLIASWCAELSACPEKKKIRDGTTVLQHWWRAVGITPNPPSSKNNNSLASNEVITTNLTKSSKRDNITNIKSTSVKRRREKTSRALSTLEKLLLEKNQDPLQTNAVGVRLFRCTMEGCGHASTDRNGLTIHVRTHTGERPYHFPVEGCSYAAATTSRMTLHVRTHTGEKPYRCPEEGCSYAAADRSALTSHLRARHTGEKQFHCQVEGCSYAAATARSLTIHVRSHTNVRPYRCPVEGCGYAAKTSSHLSSHVRRRHREERESLARGTDDDDDGDQEKRVVGTGGGSGGGRFYFSIC